MFVRPLSPNRTPFLASVVVCGLVTRFSVVRYGNVIASRHIEKVFAADRYSVLGIAGSAGIAIDTHATRVSLQVNVIGEDTP